MPGEHVAIIIRRPSVAAAVTSLPSWLLSTITPVMANWVSSFAATPTTRRRSTGISIVDLPNSDEGTGAGAAAAALDCFVGLGVFLRGLAAGFFESLVRLTALVFRLL